MATSKALSLPEPPHARTTLGTLLAEVREDRLLTPADMARALKVSHPAITQFEEGTAASNDMVLGYMRFLVLTPEELEAITDRLAAALVSSVYDKTVNPLERAMIADRLNRASQDGYAVRIREAVDAEPYSDEGYSPKEGRTPLSALKGPRPNR